MDTIVINGVRPYDGRYDFDLEGAPLTVREWGWIKRLSGYLPLTVDEGLAGADPELFAVFAAIALRRGHHIEAREVPEVFGRLGDSPFETAIRLELGADDDAEGDALPPTESSPVSGNTSGEPLSPNSGLSDGNPPHIGTPDSGTSASESARLAS